jgi:hypothetical protein
MGIELIENIETAPQLIQLLIDQAGKDTIFRGHLDEEFKLKNTLQRFLGDEIYKAEEDKFKLLSDLTNKFIACSVKHEIPPFHSDPDKQMDEFEYARHHGCPSTFIDFTYSPFIALFFAFNGDIISKNSGKNSAIYALDTEKLKEAYEKKWRNNSGPFYSDRPCGKLLQVFKHPGKYNKKMMRQSGAFINDMMNYPDDITCLEELIESADDVICKKFIIPHSLAGAVFEYLELMGIFGVQLFLNEGGATMDVNNTRHYTPKTMLFRS